MSNDTREKLVRAYEELKKSKIVAKAFNVSKSTVFRLVCQNKETGTVKLQTHKRERKPKLTPKQQQKVKERILIGVIDKRECPLCDSEIQIVVHEEKEDAQCK